MFLVTKSHYRTKGTRPLSKSILRRFEILHICYWLWNSTPATKKTKELQKYVRSMLGQHI